MAKRNSVNPGKTRQANQERRKATENPRMALLAKELGIAMHQVLTDYYLFDDKEANKAVTMMLRQAKGNRELYQATAIAAHLADEKPESVFTPEALSAIKPAQGKAIIKRRITEI
jgi:uncharacterized protein YcaQ